MKKSDHGRLLCGIMFALFIATCVGQLAAIPKAYAPTERHYRPVWEADSKNKARQGWDDYYGWVRQFYSGRFLLEGWTSRSQRFVKVLREPQRAGVQARLNAIGFRASAEWAKDNDIRRIDSADLKAWTKRLEDAAKADDGSGLQLNKALSSVESEIAKKLVGEPVIKLPKELDEDLKKHRRISRVAFPNNPFGSLGSARMPFVNCSRYPQEKNKH